MLAQLGSRIQHQLRAATPNDAKALKQTVNTYPTSSYDDLGQVILSLGIGEAIVTVMNERGAPTPVAWTRLRAPESLMGPADAAAMDAAVKASPSLRPLRAGGRPRVGQRAAGGADAGRRREGGRRRGGQEPPTADKPKPAPKPKAAKPQDSTFEKVVKSDTFQYAAKYAVREAVRGHVRHRPPLSLPRPADLGRSGRGRTPGQLDDLHPAAAGDQPTASRGRGHRPNAARPADPSSGLPDSSRAGAARSRRVCSTGS